MENSPRAGLPVTGGSSLSLSPLLFPSPSRLWRLPEVRGSGIRPAWLPVPSQLLLPLDSPTV